MPRSAFIASALLLIAGLSFPPGCGEPQPSSDARGSGSVCNAGDASRAESNKVEHPEARIKPMKGVEIYCWMEDGEEYYAVLIGTNRWKEEKEIRAAAVRSLEEVKDALEKYVEGTDVVTVRDARNGKLVFTGITSPAEYRDLQERCKKLGLRLDSHLHPGEQ